MQKNKLHENPDSFNFSFLSEHNQLQACLVGCLQTVNGVLPLPHVLLSREK